LQAGQGGAIDGLGGIANTGGSEYDVTVDDFYYSFPVGGRITVTAAARGLAGDDWVTSTIVPFDGPGVADASGPQFYDVGGGGSSGAGVGVNIAFTDNIILDLGYTAGGGDGVPNTGAFDPAVGIFASTTQSYIAQLNFLTDGFFDAAVAYLHNDQSGGTDTFAGLLNLDFGRFFAGGHGAFRSFTGGDDFSWTAGLGVNDFLMEGSQLGVYGGQLPQLAGYSDNPFMVEGYYEIPFNQFLTITPAVIYGDLNVAGATDNTGLWGALRATFRF
jgi:hypothetical protein